MSWWRRLVEWLRALFRRRVTRDVARLPAASGPRDARGRARDVAREEVRLEGPLKEHHLRRISRDPRLLPKPPRAFGEKRKKVMSAEEAGRLFAGTLRTTRRELRDLLPDEAQLARHGLPLWRTEQDVARALGIELGLLRHLSIHRPRERVTHYVSFTVPKARGGVRVIQAPKRKLKKVQRALLRELVERLPPSPHAHGFVRGRSVRTGAEPHVGKRVLLLLDLERFFPTITYARVRGLLIALGYGFPVAATLATLCTEPERQPVEIDGQRYLVPVGPRVCVQGAPTSPALANALTLRLDRRLAGLARKHGFAYTRYADDLCFSGDDVATARRLRALAARVIVEEGFALNAGKTRLLRRGGAQRVTGVTVNDVLGLSRQERRKLRAAIHRERTTGATEAERRRLDGHLAWVHMLAPAQAGALRKRRTAS